MCITVCNPRSYDYGHKVYVLIDVSLSALPSCNSLP